MKKLLLILLPLLIICTCAGFVLAQNNKDEVTNMTLTDKKILVAYFSWGGNTKLIAEKIHTQVGGDIFRIEPVAPYPDDYQETAYGIAKEQKDKNIHPPIKNTDVAPYDVIFVGTPAWWYTMAPPVMTFLEQNKFEGKTIIPFITHGGGGGYSVSAAQIDHRIKAVATVSMYDMGRARRQGVGDTISYEERMKTLDEIGKQRTLEFRGEKRKDIRALPVKVDENTPQYGREFIEYYENPERGYHPNSDAWYSYTSLAPMMNFFPFAQIETISPRPVLFIVGENAVSKYFSDDAYSKAAEPKELFVIKDATHVDLYDVPQYMNQALDKLENYFNQYLI